MKTINPKHYFKTSAVTKSVEELIKGPVSDLIGVSDDAAKVLFKINIKSVFDLAFSDIFKSAVYIAGIDDQNSGIAKTKQIPREVLDDSVDTTNIETIKSLGIKAIRGIGDVASKEMKESMAIATIRDLALWPPFLAAQTVVNHQYGLGINNLADPESPQDLVPKTGEYPVEVVNYHSVVLIKAPGIGNQNYKPLEKSGKIKFNFENRTTGFTEPGFGALLSFSQKWYVEGITNGSLLRSIPLAPGESTKVAVIDWRSSSTGSTLEDISQTERLSNSITQKRALEEIASATAHELQAGSSEIDTTGDTETTSEGGWGFAIFQGGGGQYTESDVDTNTTAFTTSEGTKDISSQMQQKIDNSTQQKSFSARNKRASVVTEIRDTESETITTRTVTNYNHMHALTMQYWQVVQIYRTEVHLSNFRRCLFIPLEVFDFTDERIIARFKTILIRTALNSITKELLLATNSKVNVRFTAKPYFESITEAKKRAIEKAKFKMKFTILNRLGFITDFNLNLKSWSMNSEVLLYNLKWETNESNALKSIKITSEDGLVTEISNNGVGFSNDRVNPDIAEPISLSRIDNIMAVFDNLASEYTQELTLKFKLFGNRFQGLTLKFFVEKNKTSIKILEIDQPIASNELSELLNENSLYYSQQIWLNADVHFLILQLSQYSYKGKPVVESIDPKPVAVAGNCLGFIWHNTEDKEWKDWVEKNINLDKVTTQKIALPTDGVFGEAVLGRFNSAEKLDITRFWNWQDSPIPFTAPDISPIQAGQHQASQPQQPGSLDAPVVNIMNPPALPDPTGMQGILQALVTTNLFRDMSGITQAAAMANTVTNASSQSAIAAGQQLASNLNAQVEFAKSLVSLIPMLFGLPPLSVPGGKNISTAGAAFNAAQNLDLQSGSQNSQAPNPSALTPSDSSSADNLGTITASTRGETGRVMDMITGVGTLRGVPIDFIRNAITGQVPSASDDTTEFVRIIGDPLGTSPQSIELTDLLVTHIKNRTKVPDSNGICVDACYQYLMDALKENHIQIFLLHDFPHGFPHIVTHGDGILPGLSFIKLFYSNPDNINWQGLPSACRGKGPVGAMLFADLIANRNDGITISKNKWPNNMVPGTLLQLWTNENAFEDVRDTGKTLRIGHAPIFLAYKDDDPNSDTIIVADQYNLSTEYTYPIYGLKYVIAAKPGKIELVKV